MSVEVRPRYTTVFMFRSVLAATLGALVLLVSGPASSQSPVPYTIDAIISLTGSYAFVGNQDAEALRVFEDYANRKGGIQGKPIHFEIHDDGSSPQQAVQLSTQLIAKHSAAVIGSQGGSLCGAMMPLFKDGPVMYCLVPSIYPVKDSYVFAAQVALNPFVNGMLRYMRLRGWKKIAIISSTDGSGAADDVATKDSLALSENKDMQIVTWEHFNPTDVNVNAQSIRIKSSGAQAVLVWTAGTSFGTVLRSFNDTGVELPVETSNANAQVAQLLQYASFLPKELYMPGPPYLSPAFAKTPSKKAVDDMFDAYAVDHKKPQPGSAPSVWDTSMIVFGGLQKLGANATASDLRTYILGIHNYAGVNGQYDFSRGDQHGLSDQSVVLTAFDPKSQEFHAVSGPGGVPVR